MIYRPHFTYIEATTPEQTQAREAAANEEWRKKIIKTMMNAMMTSTKATTRGSIAALKSLSFSASMGVSGGIA